MIIASFGFAYFGEYTVASGLIGAVIGVYLILFLFRKFYTPWYLKKHYRKYPAIQRPMSLSVTDAGVKFMSDSGEGTVAWRDIYKWREGKDLLLIYPAPRIYYMVPKRVDSVGDLCEILKSKVGKET